MINCKPSIRRLRSIITSAGVFSRGDEIVLSVHHQRLSPFHGTLILNVAPAFIVVREVVDDATLTTPTDNGDQSFVLEPRTLVIVDMVAFMSRMRRASHSVKNVNIQPTIPGTLKILPSSSHHAGIISRNRIFRFSGWDILHVLEESVPWRRHYVS
jgi:hypothetical protein